MKKGSDCGDDTQNPHSNPRQLQLQIYELLEVLEYFSSSSLDVLQSLPKPHFIRAIALYSAMLQARDPSQRR